MTKAQLRALQAVRDGRVVQVYDRTGNVFRGPAGISARNYRALEVGGLIEDVPGQGFRASGYYKLQLTGKGRAILRNA